MTNITINMSEFDALSRLAQAEARIQTQTGGVDPRTAYGSVVDSIMNRVATPDRFGDTIIEVIEQPNGYEALDVAGSSGDWRGLSTASAEVQLESLSI